MSEAARPGEASLRGRVTGGETVLEIEDALLLRLDAEGRWITYAEAGAVLRRTLDGGVVTGADRRPLAADDAARVERRVARRAHALLARLDEAGAAAEIAGDRDAMREALARAASRGAAARANDRARFAAAHPEPVPILPPHRYRDLVVMPATGCPNHACTFCAFYRDHPFRRLDDDAFEAHLDALEAFYGRARAARHGIFLGSASALSLPDDVLLDRLARIERRLGAPRRGHAAFFDADRGPRRDAAAWRTLAEAGLGDATLGLETALPALRRRLGKSDDLPAWAGRVRAMVEGGQAVSLCVLVGLGGTEEEAAHRTATVAFLADLPLGAGDRVYLAPRRGADVIGDAAADLPAWRAALGEATQARVDDYRIERFAWLA